MPKTVQTTAQLHSSHTLAKECSKQQYMNWELPDLHTGFKKGRGTRDQTANICWITEKAREFQKTSISASLTKLKPLTVWFKTNHGNLSEMGLPYHLICLLRNLYAGQQATVRIRHRTMDWFHTGKGVRQGCMLSPCLFNLYVEYISWNAELDKSQAGLPGKISTISYMQMIAL